MYLFGFIEGFVHRLPVVEDWFLRDRSLKQVRSAVFRSAFVLPSEKFVRSILGDAFFEALLLQYNKGGARASDSAVRFVRPCMTNTMSLFRPLREFVIFGFRKIFCRPALID